MKFRFLALTAVLGAITIGSLSTTQAADDVPSWQQEAERRFDAKFEALQNRIELLEQQVKSMRQKLADEAERRDQTIDRMARQLQDEAAASDASSDSDLPASVIAAEGWKLWQDQDFAAAYKKFRVAVDRDPNLERARNGLAWSMLHLGMREEAEKEFRSMIADGVDHGGVTNGLGQTLLSQERYGEAIEVLSDAVQSEIDRDGEAAAAKKGIAAWFGLVRALTVDGQKESANMWADRFLKHQPNASMESLRDAAKR